MSHDQRADRIFQLLQDAHDNIRPNVPRSYFEKLEKMGWQDLRKCVEHAARSLQEADKEIAEVLRNQ
jgi:hypothetical protein